MLMHFINNGIAITAIYMATSKGKSVKDVMDESYPIWVGGIALVVMILLISLYKKACNKNTVAV